ncbi:hypothetical protein ELE36_00225 [Pseudolysobacter antarcticus]|uniref:Tetratricopeptide repeat protein n=1 Tax=Pseudolysobacter antarcticus TaxID=2511995 RepID=A0A411HEL6_9GAMM|nr:hypothetical protein [Pseudolysobacter antarcticus]QBB68928.1 hypothetical protein ELE36_00225 [Pseudolysobacter antarcticus]
MSSRKHLFCALALLLGTAMPALACGPDFPQQLLADRRDTLLVLPEGTFDFEVSRLSPALTDKFKAIEAGPWEEPTALRDKVDHDNLRAEELEKVTRVRSQADAEKAYAEGVGLSEELRTYTAGAVAFSTGQYPAALSRFNAVLALPATERARRGTWAAYMAGRSLAKLNRNDDAAAAFVRTRELAQQGAADPLGLAVASFGEQARLLLDRGETAKAIALYAEQAAHNSTSGRASLLQIARKLIAQPQQFDTELSDPLTQRLLIAYAFTRSGELEENRADSELAKSSATPIKAATTLPPAIEKLLKAIEARGLDKVSGVDRLAAFAYRAGRYDLAEKYAMHDDSALNWWIRAKLALRKGDTAAAAQAYAKAASSFPQTENWGAYFSAEIGSVVDLKPACRVNGEAATLALSRRDYREAMDLLYRAGSQYWTDAAYVAERVLSIDELKAYVDAKVPASTAKPGATNPDGEDLIASDPATQLRALLARRLLRSARYDEASVYFDNAELQGKSRELASARHASEQGAQIARARGFFAAAKIERSKGMELLGFEGDPDFALYAGDFDLNSPFTYDAGYNAVPHPRTDLKIIGDYTSDDERSRVASSKAAPLARYHYRLNAVDDAGRAADLLPPRTQAFAAVLCQATSWIIDREPAIAQNVYARYLKQGALVPWGASFGRTCPEPDFAAAEKRLWDQRMAFYKHQARHWAPWIGGALIVLIGFIFWRRRRVR